MSFDESYGLLTQGCSQIVHAEELKERLKAGRPLKIKYGADPSAPDLHLGHTVVLRKLRQFQDQGHQVQFLIGDFTAMIGDPTGRSATRPPLTLEQVQTNAKTYAEQVFKVLKREQTTVVFNHDWLSPMNFSDVIRLASRYTVARILERDDFENRFEQGRPIGVHELLYPLIQGHDSVVLQSDVELCGTDQIFNCLVARDLQQEAGQPPEIIMAMPLLEGLDGVQKMSKSLGNFVGLTDSPKDMFGKLMSIPDNLMVKYFTLLTDLPAEDIQQLQNNLANGSLHPRDAKSRLASHLVTAYHNLTSAQAAQAEFDRVFRDRAIPQDIPVSSINVNELKDGKLWVIRLLQITNLVTSRNDAQRQIQQGAVEIDQQRISDPTLDIEIKNGMIVQVGKRRFARISLSQ
jgi:tyrosyl-tRNA synthetase